MHDPRIGRFFAVDPLFAEYPMLTPYQFASLNPIFMFELEGLEGVPATKQPNGTFSTAQSATWIHTKNVVPLEEKRAKPLMIKPRDPGSIRSAGTPAERYKNWLSVTSPATAEVASDPFVQSAIQTAIGVKAVGTLANLANGTKSLLLSKTIAGGGAFGIDLYNQGVSKNDFSFSSYDFANAGFKGLKTGVTFGTPSSHLLNRKILDRSISDIGSDFLSSAIDFRYINGEGFTYETKFNTEGLFEFGYRTGFGFGVNKLKVKGNDGYNNSVLDISNKAARSKVQRFTLKLLDE